MTTTPDSRTDEGATGNFIRTLIEDDLRQGRHDKVITRFPPEPNGYLHIGHAKSICLNFGLALDYDGVCHLRFDDTNPSTEDPEYVESIQHDIRWLGFDWGDKLFFASDYFEQLYEWAEWLVNEGLAYVDSSSEEAIREARGTVTEPGRASTYRSRTVAENLELLRRMKAGEFDDGAHVLRAKIDLAHPNMKMRDPLLYRIRRAHHYRRGDDWCIYPFYDYAHCLSDAIEGITHSICTLEFENNRDVYDWLVGVVPVPSHPKQTEFARLHLSNTVMSKRRLLRLVKEGHVKGWDDPRMPTIAGLRRRGVTPEAIRDFSERIGVAKADSLVDLGLLEHSIRTDLNHRAPRVMCVLEPLKVVIENYPEGQVEELEAAYWPHDVGKQGSRLVPFSRELYVERADFRAEAPRKWHRLAPGAEVRLRYGYFIRCTEVVTDPATGEVVELRCTYDPATRGGDAPDGRKVKGTLHWVSAAHAVPVEVRLYDRLFTHERPDAAEGEFLDYLNPDSVQIISAFAERSVVATAPSTHLQFERQGFFFTDPVDSGPGHLVFNRVVALRDGWAKLEMKREEPAVAATAAERAAKSVREPAASPVRPATIELSAEATARRDLYRDTLGVGEDEANQIAADADLSEFFEAAAGAASAATLAKWVVNELRGVLGDRTVGDIALEPARFGALVALVEEDAVTGRVAKELLAEVLDSGADPVALVDERGLRKVKDAGALDPIVEAVLAEFPDRVTAYQEGRRGLFGFFMGQVMQRTGGTAAPDLVKELLTQRLG